MSFFTLAKYLANESNENEQLMNLMQTAASHIEENEKLKEQAAASWENKCRFEMELYTLESIHEQHRVDKAERNDALSEARNAYANFLGLCEQLKNIEFNKIANFDIQQEEQQWKENIQEMEREYHRQRQLHTTMENRGIVQQLRQQQQENTTNEAEQNEAKGFLSQIKNVAEEKIEAAKAQRNEKIINLIQGSKELQRLRDELDTMNKAKTLQKQKEDLQQKLQHLQGEPKSSPVNLVQQKVNCAQVLDTFTTNSFFETFNIKIPQLPAFHNLFNAINIESVLAPKTTTEVEEEDDNSFRSILRKDQTTADESYVWPTAQKHVHFETRDMSDESGSISSSPAAATNSAQRSGTLTEAGSETGTTPNSTHTQHTLDFNDSETLERSVTPSFELCTNKKLPNNESEKSTNKISTTASANDATNVTFLEKQKPKIDIQDCRIIKPAGTPLPEVLPTILSPESAHPPERICEDDIPTQVFKVPTEQRASRTVKQKNFASFDDLLKCTTSTEAMELSDIDLDSNFDEPETERGAKSKVKSAKCSKYASNPFEDFMKMSADDSTESASNFMNIDGFSNEFLELDVEDANPNTTEDDNNFDYSDLESQDTMDNDNFL